MQGPRFKAQINCPECGTVNFAPNGTESFPKNLVLLQVGASQPGNASIQLHKTQSLSASIQPKETSSDSSSSENNQTPVNYNCTQHPSKKLEAYCESCFTTLCIDCILSDSHKSHLILSVPKALDRHNQFLSDELSSLSSSESLLLQLQSDLLLHLSDLHKSSERNL